ncbi:MAG TPA: iron donor protein CyaY [Usitatibacteraceae bacterium]|nr:iron donor protein CyaY [Usitatibacteraceae bacterium]
MNESEFHQAVDAVLDAIEGCIEESGAPIDCELAGGILTIEFADGSKVIVNRQTANREIWVAARSGGFHFRHIDGAWRDTRSAQTLDALLSHVVSAQSGSGIAVTTSRR